MLTLLSVGLLVCFVVVVVSFLHYCLLWKTDLVDKQCNQEDLLQVFSYSGQKYHWDSEGSFC